MRTHRIGIAILACSILSTTCSSPNRQAGEGTQPETPSPPTTTTEYKIETNCAGGGGLRECVATNRGDSKLGPFSIEFEFLDEHLMPLGRTTVRNDHGLEVGEEWHFNLTSSPRTRSLRTVRVIPG